MSGFGRPIGSSPARGVKLTYLLNPFIDSSDYLGISPDNRINEVASSVRQYLVSIANNKSNTNSSLGKILKLSWCEKYQSDNDVGRMIQAANLHIIASEEDNFCQVVNATCLALENGRIPELLPDTAYVYFTFLDDRQNTSQLNISGLANNQRAIASIPHCLIVISDWQQIRVSQEYPCLHGLLSSSAPQVHLTTLHASTEESFATILCNAPELKFAEFLSNLKCSPNPSSAVQSTEEIGLFRSAIEGNNATEQFAKINLKLKNAGSKFVIYLLENYLRREESAHGLSSLYNQLEFAFIRVLCVLGETQEAQRRNETLLQRLLEQRQDSDTSNIAMGEIVSVLLSLTGILSRKCQSRQVEVAISQVLPEASSKLGCQHPLTLRLRKELAASRRHQAQYSVALTMLQDLSQELATLLNPAETSPESDSENRYLYQRLSIEVLTELGCCQKGLCERERAKQTFRLALNAGRELLEGSNNNSSSNSNDSQAADPLLKQIEALIAGLEGYTPDQLLHIRNTYGEISTEYFVAVQRLGTQLLSDQQPSDRRPHEAAALLWQAYEIANQLPSLGPDHIMTSSCMLHHGRALIFASQVEEGFACLQQAKVLRDRVLGPNDSKSINPVQRMAETLETMGRIDDAYSVYQECLRLRMQSIEMGLTTHPNPDVMATLTCLACICERKGKIPEAIQYMQMAYTMSIEGLGADNEVTLARGQKLQTLQGNPAIR